MEATQKFNVDVEVAVRGQRSRALVDTGAGRSVMDWSALRQLVGTAAAEGMLFKDGYMPYFEVADGSVVQCMGQVKLDFTIQGVKFRNVFFVMERCSRPIILGNDFLHDASMCLNYKRGVLLLENESGVRVESAVGLVQNAKVPSLYSLLYATEARVVPCSL